jgi:hypothetical protein
MKQGSVLHERGETNSCPTRDFEKEGEKNFSIMRKNTIQVTYFLLQ